MTTAAITCRPRLAVSGSKVNTKLVLADTDEPFRVTLPADGDTHAKVEGMRHPDAYVLGLEDTRVVVDAAMNNTIYTLSASAEFSEDDRTMNQILSILNLTDMTHTIQAVIESPYLNHHDKNWVFAGGIANVVYGWYPSIKIGAVDPTRATLRIHTTIPSPSSFESMRGSTNGVLFEDEWWFVTHAVTYRPGQRRKYLHRLVVLDSRLATVVRHSLPFMFEQSSDVEYCLGLFVDASGLTFGYSVRDRSSKMLEISWRDVDELF